MRTHVLAVALALGLSACGGASGSIPGGPPSAKIVAANDSDWPGLQRCPESGSFDSYLSLEKAKVPDWYARNNAGTLEQLASHGANDTYIAVEAADTADCGLFGFPGANKVAYVYAIRFNSPSLAAASYKTSASELLLADIDPASARAAGATVEQGTATGLGDNSITITFGNAVGSFWVGFWQVKEFKLGIVAYLEPVDAPAAAKKITGRIK